MMDAYRDAAEAVLDGIKNKINPGDPIEENIYEMDFRRITGAGIDTVEWCAYRVQVHQLELDRYPRLL